MPQPATISPEMCRPMTITGALSEARSMSSPYAPCLPRGLGVWKHSPTWPEPATGVGWEGEAEEKQRRIKTNPKAQISTGQHKKASRRHSDTAFVFPSTSVLVWDSRCQRTRLGKVSWRSTDVSAGPGIIRELPRAPKEGSDHTRQYRSCSRDEQWVLFPRSLYIQRLIGALE